MAIDSALTLIPEGSLIPTPLVSSQQPLIDDPGLCLGCAESNVASNAQGISAASICLRVGVAISEPSDIGGTELVSTTFLATAAEVLSTVSPMHVSLLILQI